MSSRKPYRGERRVLTWMLSTFVACCMFLGASCGGDGAAVQPPPGNPPLYDADGNMASPSTANSSERPNLVVILLDTLRRDAVSYPGETGGVMPHLASMAKSGVAFSNAVSPSSWTVPAVTSMLTGLQPHEHMCTAPSAAPQLSPSITTYTEALHAGHGYETAVFTGAAWFRESPYSILQGFQRGSVGFGFGLQGTEPQLGQWVKSRDPNRPFFLLLHTFEAHDPYGRENHPYPDTVRSWRRRGLDAAVAAFPVGEVREPWEMTRVFFLDRVGRAALERRHGRRLIQAVTEYTWQGLENEVRPELTDALREAYYEGATWVDSLVKESMETLADLGLLENTLVVVTSDHGESFGEHGMIGHGRQLYDELVHIPMIMTGPAPFDTPALVEESVGLMDVMPTFFDWAGLPDLPGTQGHSVLPLMASKQPGRPVISEERLTPRNTVAGVERMLSSVRDRRWKFLIEYDIASGAITESVFDLALDPDEQQNLLRGDLEEPPPWSDAFCKAVDGVRERLSVYAERDRKYRAATGDEGSAAFQARLPDCDLRSD